MGKSAREYMKRRGDRAINGLEKTLQQLHNMKSEYDEGGEAYKEYSDYIEVLMTQVLMAHQNLKTFMSRFL